MSRFAVLLRGVNVVKSASELQAIEDGNPIVPPEAEHGRFLVAFAMAPDRLTALLGKVGKGVTSRNWGTVIKLAALV
ncbi:hypothetical protein [Hydrogenophaga pseudoflava]|uniref:DUF1697 domain-containing protein n=1 Tax=Hydrogenophaga pseudoflava TaxID=47421 RepID=A0A4P6WUP3_HYDPS|nr:hypothetical protein [Hydrogenophaga pseudoflava]QBM26206.1 hypothetical protein HPF_00855 [Hydrogenophaga pseudoflava]